jgi:hypothetical protein
MTLGAALAETLSAFAAWMEMLACYVDNDQWCGAATAP